MSASDPSFFPHNYAPLQTAGAVRAPVMLDAYALLARLTRLAIIGEYDVRHQLPEMLQLGLRVLSLDRAVMWRMSGDRESIVVDATASNSSVAVRSFPRELHAAARSHYFRAVGNGEIIVASADQIDAPMMDLWADYAAANGISAKLDVPLMALGRTFGLMSFERLGGSSTWSTDDVTLALQIANLVQLGDWESRAANPLLESLAESREHALPALRNYQRL